VNLVFDHRCDRLRVCAALVAAVIGLIGVRGEAKDVEGSQDYPLLKRISGAEIVAYDRKDYDELRFPLQRIVFNLQTQKFNRYETTTVRGRRIRLLYELPEGVTTIDAYRNYETELKTGKSEILFAGTKEELDNGGDRFVDQVYRARLENRLYKLLPVNRDNAYVAAKLRRNGDDVFVQVYLFANTEGRSTALVGQGRVGALVEVVEPNAFDDRMVSSEQMADEIARSGRIALYGLYFDTGRIEIKPESRPTLEQIADLLKRQPGLKLLVVGHTDNVGDFESNRDLSQRRAGSVVNALVTGFGIGPERLIPFGVSYASPVASNETSEGRSRNRRVELVRY
jgi:outer membrane protein OmpA-like peptidoglycan-associated protein